MSSQVANYKCPACGGPMQYVATLGKLECNYCENTYTVEEIEALLQVKDKSTDNSKWTVASGSSDWGAEGMKTYTCPSCGAELICDENTAATCCPYCGNQAVIATQFAGSLRPDFVIPFKTSKEQTITALKNHYKGKRLLPNSFANTNHIEEIQGVYVPFWLFDCEASGEIVYSATKSNTKRTGDKEIITTMYYDIFRNGSLTFSNVPVDASTRMPDQHMDSIEPYDYSELKPFSMAYMPGFLADKFDVTVEECGGRMEKRCRQTFIDEIKKTVEGYDKVTEKSKNISIKKGTVHYAMLPVWLLATKWNNQNFLFAMNGQSGKFVGDLPIDKGKYWGYLGGIGAALVGFMQVINNFVMTSPMKGATMTVICVVLPLLIAWFSVSVMKWNLSSVHTGRKASGYISGSGVRLSRKDDVYVNTVNEVKESRKK